MTEVHVYKVPKAVAERAWIDEETFTREYERSLTDPDRFWVACQAVVADARPSAGDLGAADESIVGFASANVRGSVWFLAMLFVDPAAQSRGLGRRLLEHSMRGSETRILGTATDSAQPISNALYARLGIVPHLPVPHLIGDVERPEPTPVPGAGGEADACHVPREFGPMGEEECGRVSASAGPAVAGPDAQFRAALVASQVLGLALTRYVLELDPLVRADVDELAAAIGPTLERYLTGQVG